MSNNNNSITSTTMKTYKKEEDALKVIFRTYKEGNDVIAIFPYEIADNAGNVESYQYVGMHGACTIHYKSVTRPATFEEANEMLEHLEKVIGYTNLKVLKRKSWKEYGTAKMYAWNRKYKRSS